MMMGNGPVSTKQAAKGRIYRPAKPPSPQQGILLQDHERTGDRLTPETRNLVHRCQSGEAAAIAALIERFQGQVFGLCFRMLGQRQDAEDMCQETFVRAVRSLDSFELERPFEPWLLSIAGNRCRTL